MGRFQLATALTTMLVAASILSAAEPTSPQPNVLIILADDLGYSDLGCFGGEIETPNLDRLAEDGLRFSQFYNTGRCWPTRAALMTGFYAQAVRRDTVPGVRSGGQGKRPDWAPLLAARLQKVGYRCYHSGKWHIDNMPLQTGFDHSYYLKDQGRFFSPTQHYRDDQPLPAVARDSGYYGTTAIGSAAVEMLQQHATQNADSPFLLYLAFTAPHFPLHAPQELIDLYRQRYRAGWDAIRQQRWKRIESLGFIRGHLSDVQPDVGPPYDFPDAIEQLGAGELNRPLPWDQLTSVQQEFQSTKMAIHAAMVHALDQQVGRVLEQLRKSEMFQDTLILFLSDNGASAEIMVRSDGHDPQAAPGSAASYLCLGPGWSTVCNTPLRYHKTWVHEGGISTAALAHWPAHLKATNQWSDRPTHVIDVVPTVLELAGAKDTIDPQAPTLPGVSFAKLLQTGTTSQTDRPLYWHHEGNRAVRLGDWKLVAVDKASWELYDLSQDRTETNDLSDQYPEKVQQLAQLWESLHQQQIELATRPH